MDWLKDEIRDIKTCIVEIAEHLKGDVDLKLEEIIDRMQEIA
jgi:hypothetical protein